MATVETDMPASLPKRHRHGQRVRGFGQSLESFGNAARHPASGDLVVADLEVSIFAVRVAEIGPRASQIVDTNQPVLVLVEGRGLDHAVTRALRVPPPRKCALLLLYPTYR